MRWNLYLITEEKLSNGRKTLEIVREAAAGGVDVIQLREKKMGLHQRYHLGLKVKEITDRGGITLIVNDRVDLALALDAHGVHLGQKDMPLPAAREIMGENKIIGISVSTVDEARRAEEHGADYLGVGAVYETDSKNVNNDRAGIGAERINEIDRVVNIPIIAIGGLDISNVHSVIKNGADGIAVISALTKADNIEKKTRKFKEKILELKKGVK
ncbi:MAG: thiamine phosphate synthase [Halanaerobiales bacterium]